MHFKRKGIVFSSSRVSHTLSNHVINWDDAKVFQMECDVSARLIRESIWMRKGTKIINRDKGAYFLSQVNPLLISHDNRMSNAEEEVTLKKSVPHDGQNCQVSVNFNLVLFR